MYSDLDHKCLCFMAIKESTEQVTKFCREDVMSPSARNARNNG